MKNIITGFNLPNEHLSRNYELVKTYENVWLNWLNTTGKKKFNFNIPINGIVESIEKICSSSEFERFVLIRGEVDFYKNVLLNYSKNFIIIDPGQWNLLKDNDLICLSMPFSPFGNIPEWYFDLIKYTSNKNIFLFIDGAYLGTIEKTLYIPANCKYLAVSVSKCFNASGLRSGILFCDHVLKNFVIKKNLENYNYYAMEKTIDLLTKYNSLYTFNKYRQFQVDVCKKYNLIPSESVVLGYTFDLNNEYKQIMNFNKELNVLRYSISKDLK